MSVVLVTGAASGLGWAMTRRWHEAGHELVLADVDAAGLADRVAGLDPDRVLGVVTDVTDAGDLAALVAAQTDHELAEQAWLQKTADFAEGVRAVNERRPGNFRGE